MSSLAVRISRGIYIVTWHSLRLASRDTLTLALLGTRPT